MKFAVTVSVAILSFTSAQTFAAGGQYACKLAEPIDESGRYYDASQVQAALNSLNCDVAKPISTTPLNGSGSINKVLVCCVQK